MSSAAKRPRIVHLIDPDGPMAGWCAVAMLGDLAVSSAARSHDLLALIVGGSSAERRAQRLGVATSDRMACFGGRPWLGAGTLRRYLRAVGPVDLVHCWSPATLALSLLAGGDVPRVLSLTANPLSVAHGHWLRMLAGQARSGLTILAASNCIRRAWAQAGVDPAIMHVLRPGLDLARLDADARDALRAGWGVKRRETTVLGVLTQHGPCVDAGRAAHVLANAVLSGLDAAMIVPAAAARRSISRTIARGGKACGRLIFDSRLDRPWEVLPGLDAALILGDDTADGVIGESEGGGTRRLAGAGVAMASLLGLAHRPRPGQVLGVLPMLWAAAAGRTIIAEAGYAVSEIVEHGRTALVVKPGDSAAAVQRLREILADGHRAWSLRDSARSEAFSYFSCSRYAENTVLAYEQILSGSAVRLPDLPVTGGLAFAGRA